MEDTTGFWQQESSTDTKEDIIYSYKHEKKLYTKSLAKYVAIIIIIITSILVTGFGNILIPGPNTRVFVMVGSVFGIFFIMMISLNKNDYSIQDCIQLRKMFKGLKRISHIENPTGYYVNPDEKQTVLDIIFTLMMLGVTEKEFTPAITNEISKYVGYDYESKNHVDMLEELLKLLTEQMKTTA
ncbi:MAG: hypothetical protein RSC68_00145 [Acinetobacter sp.]